METEETTITQKIKKTTSHFVRNRGRYGVAIGMIAGGYITRNLDNETYKEAMAFIDHKGLKDEFFNPQYVDWQDIKAS